MPFDFRKTKGCNDREFEQSTMRMRRFIRHDLGRLALLVGTAAGKLQMNRLDRVVSATTPIFTNKTRALSSF